MPHDRTWFSAAAKGTSADIAIYDEIGMFGITAKDFAEQVKALGPVDRINLSINSPGGAVFDGITIYNVLKSNKASVTVTVTGLAASISSLIAMAGDTIIMPENAMMMIHDPSGVVVGTSQDMRELADVLDKIKASMVRTYAGKTKMADAKIETLMADETWMTAKEAVAMGFADKVEKPIKMSASFDLNKFRNAPRREEDNLAAALELQHRAILAL